LQDVVIAGHGRDQVAALGLPAMPACRGLSGLPREAAAREVLQHPSVRAQFEARLDEFSQRHAGHSTCVTRLLLLEEPASIDAQEVTDKGSVNQKAVLLNRAALVDQLYGADGRAIVISLPGRPATSEREATR
jgi:feruloyl-CoA synthase